MINVKSLGLVRPAAGLQVPDGVNTSLGQTLAALPVSWVWSPS